MVSVAELVRKRLSSPIDIAYVLHRLESLKVCFPAQSRTSPSQP
jgi:hypothetical protein